MTVKKIRAAHVPTIGVESFIGEPGTLFYDHETGELRIYTGTPGGRLVYGSVSLPTDGTEGQVLAVHDDGSFYWVTPSANLPTDGTAGQVLAVDADGNYYWTDMSTGTNSTGTVSLALPLYLGETQLAQEFTNPTIQIDTDVDSFSEFIVQNHNSGTNASTDILLVNDAGDEFNSFIDLGINSSNYSQETYSVTQAGDGYLFVNGANLVLGTQSPDTAIRFHAGGTTADNAGMELNQYLLNINRRVEINVSTPSPLRFLTRNTSTNVEASSLFQAENDLGDYIVVGVNSSQRVDGNMGAGESFIYPSSEGGTFHIGNHSNIHFYTNAGTGYAGTPTLQLNASDEDAILDAHLNPHSSDEYDLGDETHRWRNLYLGTTGSLYINNIPLTIDGDYNLVINGTPIISTATVSVEIGTVTQSTTTANVTNIGDSKNVILDFTLQTGPQGAKGETGDKGDTGNTGPKGDTGTVATISIGTVSVSTSTTSVTNVGNNNAAIFDFVLQRGPQGLKGDKGDTGNTGATGQKGDKGDQGLPGNDSTVPGPKGDTGDQGVSVTLQGTKATIADLPEAPTNPTDFSGHGWIVTTGDGGGHLDGSLWFWNLNTSEWNDIGPIVGPQGDQGDPGAQGDKGDQGEPGNNGQDGAPGANGADALWFWQGEYNDSIEYVEGDVVTYQGSTYRRNTVDLSFIGFAPGAGNNGETMWDIVAVKGDQGDQGPAGPGANQDLNTDNNVQFNSVTFTNGDNSNGSNTLTQITLSYGGTTDWPHYIRTRHNDSDYLGNAIDFYTNANQTGGPNDPVLGLSIENGNIVLGNDILARPSNDMNLKVFDPGVEGAGVAISLQNRNADSGSKTTQFDVNPDSVSLITDFQGAVSGNQQEWIFSNTGTLHLPSGIGDIKRDGVSVLGGGGGAGPTDRITSSSYSMSIDSTGLITTPYGIEWRERSIYNPGNSGINIWDGPYSGPYNGEILLDLNGVNLYTNNETNQWWFNNSGTFITPGNILPNTDSVYDLGSPDKQWRHIYVNTGSIYIGNVKLTTQNNQLNIQQISNADGNETVVQDVSINAVSIASQAPDSGNGGLWYNTVDGRTYIRYSGQWVDTSPAVVPSPETYLGNITIDADTLNINGSTLTISNTGTLLVNGTQVIGSGGGEPVNIYGATITASATDPGTSTGTLWFNTVEGRTFLKYNDQWVDVNPTVVPPVETYLGNITVDGSTFNINGATLTVNTSGTLLVNGGEVTGAGGATWQITSSTQSLSIDEFGVVTFPGGYVNYQLTMGGPLLVASTGTTFALASQGTGGTVALEWADSLNSPTLVSAVVANSLFGLTTGSVQILIGAPNGPVTDNIWDFGANGVLTLSTASTIMGNSEDPNVYIETSTTVTNSTWTFGTDGVLTLPADTPVIKGSGPGTDVSIVSTTGTNTATWTFSANGNITFPDSTVQTTAWTGTVSVSQISDYTGGSGGVTSLSSLTDVNISGPITTGYVLKWNGNAWAPGVDATIGGGGTDADTLDGQHGSYYLDYSNFFNTPNITTASINTLIANSLTNYATQSYVTGQGYITTASLSVSVSSAVSGGNLSYNNGVFTFNPATTYTLTTATVSSLGGVKIGSGISASGDGTISVSTSSLLVGYATTATTVAGGYISSVTAGTGTNVSAGTGASTVWIGQSVKTTDNVTFNTGTFTGDLYFNNGLLKSTSATVYLVNSTPTTVYLAGGATLGTYIGNTSSNVTINGNLVATVNGFSVGYRDIPQLSYTTSTTLALTDAGKHYYSTYAGASTLTIPPSGTVNFAIGAAINVINQSAATMTIATGTGVTLYFAGNATPGNRTLSGYGMATLQKVAADTWWIVGVGIA